MYFKGTLLTVLYEMLVHSMMYITEVSLKARHSAKEDFTHVTIKGTQSVLGLHYLDTTFLPFEEGSPQPEIKGNLEFCFNQSSQCFA